VGANQRVVTEVDASVVIGARVTDTQEERRWLSGFGTDAEVLSRKAHQE
jgi:uncharacterized protein YfaQ (DUF2300 family)